MTTLDTPQSAATPFKYKPAYVAAWLREDSAAALRAAGVAKTVHLTTFFDGFGQLPSMEAYPWTGVKAAQVSAVVEWPVGDKIFVVAELDCTWSRDINQHYRAQGAREDLPHKAHITLEKNAAAGRAAQLQALVGQTLVFDRHGQESECKDWDQKNLPGAAAYTASVVVGGVRRVGLFPFWGVDHEGEEAAFKLAKSTVEKLLRMSPQMQPQIEALYMGAPDYEALRGELAQWRKLKDPAVLHRNLLIGFPARLSAAQLRHLGGDLFKAP